MLWFCHMENHLDVSRCESVHTEWFDNQPMLCLICIFYETLNYIIMLISLCFQDISVHDDVIKWKHFPRHKGQRPVRRSFDVFFELRLNKRLSKQWVKQFSKQVVYYK